MKKQFSLKKPCANCPFLNNGNAIELDQGRLEEIMRGLLNGVVPTFHCHKTVYRDDGRNFTDDGEYAPVDVAHCPGAAAVARKFGRDTTVAQIATRLNVISPNHYNDAEALTIEPSDLRINPSDCYL